MVAWLPASHAEKDDVNKSGNFGVATAAAPAETSCGLVGWLVRWLLGGRTADRLRRIHPSVHSFGTPTVRPCVGRFSVLSFPFPPAAPWQKEKLLDHLANDNNNQQPSIVDAASPSRGLREEKEEHRQQLLHQEQQQPSELFFFPVRNTFSSGGLTRCASTTTGSMGQNSNDAKSTAPMI